MFLSRNAYWSGPVILLLCAAIVMVALYRSATVLVALFSFLFILVFSIPIIGRSLSDGSSTVILAMQHASQLLRIFPYLLILWMLLKKKQ